MDKIIGKEDFILLKNLIVFWKNIIENNKNNVNPPLKSNIRNELSIGSPMGSCNPISQLMADIFSSIVAYIVRRPENN